MAEVSNHSLDDIIAGLHGIRDQLDEALQASSPNGMNEHEDSHKENDNRIDSFALEEYLASRLQQIGEIAPEKSEGKGLRTGNGWDANKVIEQVFKIEPISIKRATEVALSSNRGLKERISNKIRGRKDELKILGSPTVEFVPIWKVKGSHECYYLRTNSYRVNVKEDVVAVEVEGQSRDLILEKKHRRFIPAALVERLQKLGSFLTSESKYFVVNDVLELATKKTESELTISGTGRSLTQNEETALTSWRSKRIFDTSDLKIRGAKLNVRESIVSKEAVLNKFREEVIHMPERFKQILSNRLQIAELKRIYVPFIRISIQKGFVPREIVVNGSSGELADNTLLDLLE